MLACDAPNRYRCAAEETNMRGIDGKVAIVTGGAKGIGSAIAGRLVEEGAGVAIFDLDRENGEKRAAELTAMGRPSEFFGVDISDYDAVVAGVAQAEQALGPVGILINNAGWDRIEPFMQNAPDLWPKLIGINLMGPIHMTRAVLVGMVERQSGKIVSISSDAGRVGSTGEAVYSAAKGGIISFTKTIAREMARYKINVNAVCPGPTQTALLAEITGGEQGGKVIDAMVRGVPFRRLAQPADIAPAAVFFASSDADYITGQVISVSGGLTMSG
jgi:2-hydroxycyclohexanecarboxyl-CoA dehydrogenase